jgi:hypothetical protein
MQTRRGKRSLPCALCKTLVAASLAFIPGCGLTQLDGELPDAAKALASGGELPYSFVLSMDLEDDFEIDWPTE